MRRQQAVDVRDLSFDEVKRSKVVLRSETLVELGGPGKISFGCLVGTEKDEVVTDGEILLLGNDFSQLTAGEYSWGLLILLAGQEWNLQDYYKIISYTLPPGLFEGFMLKHSRDGIWCRISAKALSEGLSCAELGGRIIAHIKQEFAFVQKASVVFLLSEEEDIRSFQKLVHGIQDEQARIRKSIWEERGVDLLACVPGGHCGACKNKDTCNEVRKMTGEYARNMEVQDDQ